MQRGLYQMTQSREIFDYGPLSSVFCCSADLDGLDVKENFEYLATNCKTAVIWSWRRPSRIGLIKGQQEPCLSVKMPDWAQNVPD